MMCSLVVTRPPTGRSANASPLQRAAESLGLEVWSPDTVNTPESQSRLASLAADLLVVCDYGEILRPETLATTRLGGINLHGSLLAQIPRRRTRSMGHPPRRNRNRQQRHPNDPRPRRRPAARPTTHADRPRRRRRPTGRAPRHDGRRRVLQVIDALESGTAKPIPQDATQASKAPRLKKEQGAIDWSRPAQEIKNQVRALRPWPRAYTFWHRKDADPLRLNIDRVAVVAPTAASGAGMSRRLAPQSPGTVLDATNRLLIATADAALEILELQPAGSRSMPTTDFLRGHRVRTGERFGPA